MGTLVRRTGKMIGTESEKKIVLKKKDMKKTRKKLNTLTKDSAPVFGTSLCILERRDNVEVPLFVSDCIAKVTHRPSFITTDGLYRICGAHSDVQMIKQEIDKGNFEILSTIESVHALTSALKLFLRELPEPVIPWENVPKLLEVINSSSRESESIKMRRIRLIIQSLPGPKKATLQLILAHLAKVAEYEEQNRMGASNLGIVFGPTMMWRPEKSPPEELAEELNQQSSIMEFLIVHQSSFL